MRFGTNCNATFFRRTVDWQGKDSFEDIGTYACWNEEAYSLEYSFPWMTQRKTAKDSPLGNIVKGTLFVFEDVEAIVGDEVKINGDRFVLAAKSRFVDCKGNFGHLEFLYG